MLAYDLLVLFIVDLFLVCKYLVITQPMKRSGNIERTFFPIAVIIKSIQSYSDISFTALTLSEAY